MKKLSLATAGAASIAVGTIGAVQAATLIDTTTAWNGASSIQSFGESNTATYGQTFTTPTTDNFLDSFTFFLNDDLNPDVVDFAGYVMAWDGAKATGPILYNSFVSEGSARSTTGASGFEQFTFNTGGITLTPGQQSVAFLSASNFFDGSDGTAVMGLANDTYPGGEFIYFNNGSDFNLLTTNQWDCTNCSIGDAAFSASFSASATPVPFEFSPSLGILALGALGGLDQLKRKLQKRKFSKSAFSIN